MSQKKKDLYLPHDDALWFLPLGGAGEIGMNLGLYGTAGKWLMVDCGVIFPDEMTPGIEIIMPDISFIAARKDDLVGLVVTHGHEDHLGAIEHLWPHLGCPIYASPFTADMIRSKLGQADLAGRASVTDVPRGGKIALGPFEIEMVGVTHSVPDAMMLAIKTTHGTVLHTGDWKFDPSPVVGELSDETRLGEIGREGLMALVGDSTGAMHAGHSGSEIDVQTCFKELFPTLTGRIVVTCFSSNVARMKSIALAARHAGRYVGLVGRSLWRNSEIAHKHGYLPEFSEFLSEHEAMLAPRDKVVLISTGCQGEVRSALARIAVFDHPSVTLDRGDTVIFSSREIPGNEKSIGRVQNLLIKQGLSIITGDDKPVHASGHAMGDEFKRLYELTGPHLSVPVHGELRHQTAHAEIAKAAGVDHTLIPTNGQILRLGPGLSEIVGEVPVGRFGLDGKILRGLDRGEAVRHRRKLGFNGAAVVTLVLDQRGLALGDPSVSLLGVEDDQNLARLREDLGASVLDALEEMPKSARLDDKAVENKITQACRRFLSATHGKRPVLDIHIVRV